MKNTTEESPVEDIGDIIYIAWLEKKSLQQISDETQLPIDVVNRKLKLKQKSLIKQRVKSHEQESHF